MRLGAFLRDYVIEFGPADVNDVPRQNHPEAQPTRVYELPVAEPSEISLLSIPRVDREGIKDDPVRSEDTLSVSDSTTKGV
ncbi:hypothetical protein BDV93DRAFT_525525 [Ceratobasidium sp. AG-I]|nr:hypothetical protein BDV93DRAFT_525525 [Ceratobasidium sp. AG-I]